jgi:exodeoxyribonuclease VII large subunit
MSEPAGRPNLPEFSVSEISSAVKRLVEEAFPLVRVRGEIGGLKFHSSGHIYFDLKDDKAVLNAVVWRGAARALKVRPESGLEVICTGRISTYAGSSRYQLIVEDVELAGEGALMAMLEARKKKLADEGLFDTARKRALPFLPETIGVVTSPTGAVIRDIMHRLADRFPRRVLLWPVAVQGEKAAEEIAAAIAGFNAFPAAGLPRPDVLIVARGGGSLEDLMAFNEECVVRAAAASQIPLISAVGHETDTTLIDYAADMRAPTPTAAAEMAVPVRADLMTRTLDCAKRLYAAASRTLNERRESLRQTARLLPDADRLFAPPRQRFDLAAERLAQALRGHLEAHRRAFTATAAVLRPAGISARIAFGRERSEALGQRLVHSVRACLEESRKRLESAARMLESVGYRGVLARGFVLVEGEDGTLKRSARSVTAGERLRLSFADGTTEAVAAGHAPHRAKSKPPPDAQGDLF